MLLELSTPARKQRTIARGSRGRTAIPQYVIERDMPGVGALSGGELQGASQQSCRVLKSMGPEIQWVHSYVTDDKIYCIYRARRRHDPPARGDGGLSREQHFRGS
jgi:hypothetical protein